MAETRSDRYEPAGGHLRQALILFQELRNRTGEASVLDSLGLLHTCLGRPGQAVGYHQRALAILRELGDQGGETHVLNGLGAATLAGRPADALAHHTAADTIATEIGARGQQASAHTGLGRTHLVLGDPVRAREHFAQALARYADLGLPEADEVRAQLAELDAGAGAHAVVSPRN